MNKQKFGRTELFVSKVGFGAWAIGGPALAGETPIGWGDMDDSVSTKALEKAFDQGINFFDTADFYGLGHSEELIGKTFANSDKIIVASKVGHRLDRDGAIVFDYSRKYILQACAESLRRLQRDSIDYYQLHTAKVSDLKAGECVEAMALLKEQGKIRYWGLSLNTYQPFPEADFMLQQGLGSGFQLVFNLINQRALNVIPEAHQAGYGIIARMPLQFGLLTGKFNLKSRFEKSDHRHIRLNPVILKRALKDLEDVWKLAEKRNLSPTQLSLSFILSFPEISTVIPGMKSPEQAIENTTGIRKLVGEDKKYLLDLYQERFKKLVDFLEKQES